MNHLRLDRIGILLWSNHLSALRRLGLLYRRPQQFRDDSSTCSVRQQLVTAFWLLVHSAPYAFALSAAGYLLGTSLIGTEFRIEHLAVRLAVGLAVGLGGGIASGIAGGLASGIAVGIASGLAGGIAVGIVGGLALGLAVGIVGGLAVGIWVFLNKTAKSQFVSQNSDLSPAPRRPYRGLPPRD